MIASIHRGSRAPALGGCRAAAQLLARRLPCAIACFLLGCSDPLQLGDDLIWTADHEPGDLSQWTADGSGDEHLPSRDSTIEVSTEAAHHGSRSVKIVNPTAWDADDEGPELFHAVGALDDAYYSAWFLLPEDYRLEPSMTLVRLRSRDVGGTELYDGEELRLRSLPVGGYVLQVFSNNAGYLLEPVAEQPPLVAAGRWFQIEARYQPHGSGQLQVWLDGVLSYDLPGRPDAPGAEVVFDVCNVAQFAKPAPVVLFVDDAAVSLSRVSPSGEL